MPLTLTDHDLAELNTFAMEQFRGKEIAALQEWLRRKQMQQMAEAEKAKEAARIAAEKPSPNGHAANPYAAPAA